MAATGRLSSSDPNLQNIPARGEMGARFRRAFIPAEGFVLLAADYSQIELRVLAHMSGRPGADRDLRRGADVHQETADRVFGDNVRALPRRSAAAGQDHQLQRGLRRLGLLAGQAARDLRPPRPSASSTAYEASYPGVKEFLDREVERARARARRVTLFGRKRPVPELGPRTGPSREAGRRMALNTPIQGTAADLMKKAMIDVRRAIARSRGSARG